MPTYIAGKPQARFFVDSGIYKIKISECEEKISEKGNAMFKLICKIIMPDGSEGPDVWDFLVFLPKSAFKIDNCLWSIGRATVEGETVSVEPKDFIGKTALAEIGEKEGSINPDHKFNCILRWIYGDEKREWIEKNKPQTDKHIKAKANAYIVDADGDEIPF